MNNELVGSYAWYVILGIILFVLPLFLNVTGSDMTAYVIAIFYLISPVAVLITLFPTLSNVKIATARLEEFNYLIHQRMVAEEPAGQRPDFVKQFESIRFEDVTFEYLDGADQAVFKFGPINLEIVRGEVVFITGGNGSGKSTFINLLTGLYKPSGGSMYFNDVKLDEDNYIKYREQISAIFTNNYIFQTNYDDFTLRNTDGDLIDLFHWMKLKDVVQVDDKKNSIDTRLSKGQQKRLALIYSLLEDRGIIILDEWAAEQDPAFRSYFYNEILLTLQKQGRTIIAVTHDDHYFECADRVIKLDFGKVVSDVRKQVFV
jgi:cyclic peptide transporter